MGFGGKLKWPFKGGNAAVAEPEPEQPFEEPVDKGRLMILVSDASGFASFKSHRFADAGSAAEFVRTWYGRRLDKDNGIIAFWAMSERPAAAPGLDLATIEAVVVVRDAENDEVVYPFSFVELNEALAFVRFELNRGVEPDLIHVYWAAPVQMGVTADGSVRIYPEEPPKVSPAPRHTGHEPFAFEASNEIQLIGWSEPSDQNDPIEMLFTPKRRAAAPQNGFLMARAEKEVIEVVESREVEDAFDAIDAPETIEQQDAVEEIDADESTEADGVFEEVESAHAFEVEDHLESMESDAIEEVEAVDVVESAAETEAAADAIATEEEEVEQRTGVAEAEVEEVAAEAEPEAAAVSPAPSLNGEGESAMHKKSSNGRVPEDTAETPQVPLTVERKEEREPAGFEFAAGRASLDSGRHVDAQEELQKVLKVRRWDEREGPFSGFNSPPGRF